ncbi:galactose oxidase [Coniophora puteana RWD-64-598 SS2]|uniref:Galactose oxidase n=1 Tax=Coniophora puteana (strain RWD-64-598) TaxID=741705 RepID=R7SHF7_CONPW|nr:galactose oxidase [Coniophora puteana RWD-64-598 SS2]EIW74504.1 galactose oxidase [Coniophora puteana RWD-64-598 SS2]
MAKKKAGSTKAVNKAAKKDKAAQKLDRKEKKKVGKSKKEEADDEDLEDILEKLREEWEQAHKVTEELVEGPPSRRANASLTACPTGNYLWCIGGEYFSDDGKAYFYNDVFRYSPDKDEWRKFVSPNCPGPRSAHSVVASPAGGGRLFLFGGEFSSLYQNNFHHYRDFWYFDVATHSWERIETKIRPSARSGHRMAMWKHYIVLFGGFYDPGYRTNYLNDTWIFDTQEYKWKQTEFKENERKPSPRSGFSFIPTADGIVLHGGYCKEYVKGKRPIGVMLDDTWFLRMSLDTPAEGKSTSTDTLSLKWEKRKRPSTAFAPSTRSGCTMALWSAKSMGILFGGVTDEDTDEESLTSVFWNDLYGYQLIGNGKWVSMALKRPKNKGGTKKAAAKQQQQQRRTRHSDDDDPDSETDIAIVKEKPAAPDVDPDDPNLTLPMPRYNAMLSVLRNTLYIYGGIFEKGSREYTLDDFNSLQLDKLDRYVCLKKADVTIPDDDAESSDDDEEDGEDGEDDSDEDEDNESDDGPEMATFVVDEPEKVDEEVDEVAVEVTPQPDLRATAQEFLSAADKEKRSAKDIISTPLPGETLAMFYGRSREYWTQKAFISSDNRGKELRRNGFSMAERKYETYKPILEEVEKILAEAGLDDDEIKASAARQPGNNTGESRNRR